MTSRKQAIKASKNEKLIEKATQILQQRSAKALDVAKKMILSEKLECKEINEAFEYYAKNWNDYLHPGLISIACEAVNGNLDDSIPIQIAMLLIDACIDIHDDVIDESKTKYRMATVFGKFGKDIALLLGDAFLIRGLTHLHKLRGQVSSQEIEAIWDIINGQFFKLGDAEALEASLKGKIDISPEECLEIMKKKASSYEAHMRIGAIIGGGEQTSVNILGNYGRVLGILNRVREDFIDIFEPDELQNRMKNELLPIQILHAFKNPQTKKTIMDVFSQSKISDIDAERIVDIIVKDKIVKEFKNEIRRLAEEASISVSALNNKNAKSQMQQLLKALLEGL